MPTRAIPNELIEAILLQLPALVDSKENVLALCKFGEASSRFLAISRSPHIWREHYIVRWNRCNPEHEEMRKRSAQGDWWQMYAARSQSDSMALDLLDSIVARPEQRDIIANELVSHGYDVWQALSHQTATVDHLDLLDERSGDSACIPTQRFTIRYWALEALGVISRVRAIHIWNKMTDTSNDEFSFEHGLAALSAFFGADLDQIFEDLDTLAQKCRLYLSSTARLDSASQTEVIVSICTWMRQEKFEKSNFINLLNHFPHAVLLDKRRTLPLSLVYVFVCVARRLGMNAHPVAFPYKVLAVVLPLAGQPGEPIYVDVFESATHPILSYYEDLPAVLQQLGLDPATLPQHAAPASAATMVTRAAANIIQSLHRPPVLYQEDQGAAHYAAYCAALLLTRDPRLVQALFIGGIGGPLDRAIVFKETLASCLSQGAQQELNAHLTDLNLEDMNNCTPRHAPRDNVRYFVGMLFHHKKYEYIGIIKGWDYRCEAREEWIHRMKVNDLPRGSNQPFYQSLTQDGHNRYVAEDNIEPIFHPTPSNIAVLLEYNSSLGRWFDGVDFNPPNPVRFVLSPESRWLYPMDDAVGCAFSAQQPWGQ